MRLPLLALTLIVAPALPSLAGGLAEPVMEPEVIQTATASSSQDLVIPLLLLLVIAAAVSNGDGPARLTLR